MGFVDIVQISANIMNSSLVKISLSLLHSTAVILIIAYFLTRSQFYSSLTEDRAGWKSRLVLVLIFGLFSIYGTVSGIQIKEGAIANIRDMGPMIAGLVGGPWAGLGAGIIGGIHRYTLGGYTQLSCSISTVLAGLLGGLAYTLNRRRFVGIPAAVVLMALMELIHMGMALLICDSLTKSWAVVNDAAAPMIIANSLGIALFFFFVKNIEEEKELLKAKQFMEGELKVARDIQMSIIPRSFPAYPDHKHFQLFALLEPAREVGGDFYDFFFLDDERLFFIIGDVSGKGVPASLFMAVTRTLFRSKAQQSVNISEIITQVNNELCKDNDSAMFVTIFCGILNVETGQINYCNGGHNPPFLINSGGEVHKIPRSGDMALGVVDGIKYRSLESWLSPGDILLLYTDGVTEAMNIRGELLTEERAIDFLNCKNGLDPTRLINQLRSFVSDFEAGAPPADDVTMLAIKKLG